MERYAHLSTSDLRGAVLEGVSGTGAARYIDEARLRDSPRTFLMAALQTLEETESLDDGLVLWEEIRILHGNVTRFASTVSLMSVLRGH